MLTKRVIHEQTDMELEKNLSDSQREYLNLRIQARTGQLANTAMLTRIRRQIARIKTEKIARKQRSNQPE